MHPIRYKYGFYISESCLCGRCINSHSCHLKDTVREDCRLGKKQILSCNKFVLTGRKFSMCPCDGVFK